MNNDAGRHAQAVQQALEQVNWQILQIVPGFLSADLYEALSHDITSRFKDVSAMQAITRKEGIKEAVGSNVFSIAHMDTQLQKYGVRVATLADAQTPEVFEMIRGKHYCDIPAFVVQSAHDTNRKNESILREVIQHAEQKTGTLQFPFMITGFTVAPQPQDTNGYGLTMVPRADFAVRYDERLAGSNRGKKFTRIDESGMPLFEQNGTRTFYARMEGISELYLDGSLDVNAGNENLAYSGGIGRVVLVRDEVAGAQK